jgi:uncharacterized membrane protein YfcA
MDPLLIAGIVFLGGLVKGLNGFGYALVSTSSLAVFMPAQEAVTVMIIPLIAGNLELALETDREELGNCVRNLSGFLLFLTAGVTAGMLTISLIPSRPLKVSVGLLALAFAASQASFLSKGFERLRELCFRTWEPAIGFISGIVYGASNAGVLLVAYLKSRDLDRQKFVGTLAVAILGVSVYRVLLAQATGLYTGTDRIILSVSLVVPALAAVWTGEKLSERFTSKTLEQLSIFLIALIGVKLVLPF